MKKLHEEKVQDSPAIYMWFQRKNPTVVSEIEEKAFGWVKKSQGKNKFFF